MILPASTPWWIPLHQWRTVTQRDWRHRHVTHELFCVRDGSGCRPWASGAPLSNRKYVTSTQCCQVRGFPSELRYFKISCRGLFFMSTGWSEPNNVIFSPCNANFTRETSPKNVHFTHQERDFTGGPPSKRDWAVLGFFFFSFFFFKEQ